MIIQEVVDDVVSAYKEFGLTPHQGEYFKFGDEKCVCGIGALAYRAKMQNTTIPFSYNYFSFIANGFKRYGEDFAFGFVDGFDGRTLVGESKFVESKSYKDGYDTGKACFESVNTNEL